MAVVSAVTGGGADRVGSVAAAHIIALYRDGYGIDVSDYFADLIAADLYRCADTGLRFFQPDTLAGREDLYTQLQRFDWFYKTGKWEYDAALNHVRRGDRVLDIGCGAGNFLKLAAGVGATATGLELNSLSAAMARDAGLDVRAELLDAHLEAHAGCYDVVTAFQVLEHVTAAGAFVSGALAALAAGGTLIIGVPNNAGFLGHDADNALNLPPHHMGLWDAQSLTALPNFFPMTLQSIAFEPLAEPDWWRAVFEARFVTTRLQKLAYFRLGLRRALTAFLAENAHTIHGHTVLAVYRKAGPGD